MSPDPSQRDCDVLVLGGGPAGATAGMLLARAGFSAIVLEKTVHPRFHIGESFLPRHFDFLSELGLADAVRALPHVDKFGAEFVFGSGGKAQRFYFDQGLNGANAYAVNIERSHFDALLVDQARRAGAQILENTPVKEILRLEDGNVEVATDQRRYTARFVLDATGQGTLIGRHLGTKRVLEHHRKVAYFGQFTGVERLPGREEGHPTIVMCDEGWFWQIPLDCEKTSLGVVMDADVARRLALPADQMLRWAIERCPVLRDRTRNAAFPHENHAAADFSYKCRPYAGPGHFLIGDAAAFIDPIFSTGVCLGMMSARRAVEAVTRILRHGANPDRERRAYIAFVDGSSSILFRMINLYYHHSFRELFMHGQGPCDVHRAVISLLAGHVFPRPAWSLRWRMGLFVLCVWGQKFLPLVPRLAPFSLLESESPAGLVAAERP